MTDNEIIQGWEWHLSPVHSNGMKIYSTVIECSRELAENTFDLMNRQKAEIDILIRKKNDLQDEITEKDAEIERLTRERDFYKAPSSELARGVEQIKTEAIKEFAERLKERCDIFNKRDEPFACSFCIIDNLLKEMTVNYESSKTEELKNDFKE